MSIDFPFRAFGPRARLFQTWFTVLGAAAAALALSSSSNARAAEASADEAWAEVEKVCRPPQPPAEWRTTRPSGEAIMEFRRTQGRLAGEAADRARDFQKKYPADPRVAEALVKEFEMTRIAVQFGQEDRGKRLEELEGERLKDPQLPEDDRFGIRTQQIQRQASLKEAEGLPAVMAEFERGVRELQKEFPKRPEVYAMLLETAAALDADKGRKIAQEVIDGLAPDEVKDEARGYLKKLDALGKPFSLSYTAIDGREVNVAKLKGKVILIDFWATWCGPCVAELPNVKAAYEKLQPKGFEILGISFDQDKEALTKFIAENKMRWPQFFDGRGWQNQFGKEYGITSIPTMWLVDKKGILRDMEARGDLAVKVEKLLAE